MGSAKNRERQRQRGLRKAAERTLEKWPRKTMLDVGLELAPGARQD